MKHSLSAQMLQKIMESNCSDFGSDHNNYSVPIDDHHAWLYSLPLQRVFQGPVSSGDKGAGGKTLQLSDVPKARHVQ